MIVPYSQVRSGEQVLFARIALYIREAVQGCVEKKKFLELSTPTREKETGRERVRGEMYGKCIRKRGRSETR